MAKGGQVDFNPEFFEQVLRSEGVERLTEDAANRTLAIAQASAPVDTGDYQRGLRIRRRASKFRDVLLVEGIDWKTLIIESKTGNLGRALRQARSQPAHMFSLPQVCVGVFCRARGQTK